jgi:glycolate oxidase FAD binding subunit
LDVVVVVDDVCVPVDDFFVVLGDEFFVVDVIFFVVIFVIVNDVFFVDGEIVSAEGRVITGGGPTVKNVSGFDLPRLMTGALGTLGLLAEVILRSDPIPAVSLWLEAEAVDPAAVRAALLRPACVLWDGHRVRVLLEGHAPDVAEQRAALARVGSFVDCDGPLALPAHRWSLTPADALEVGRSSDGSVVSVGVGTAWRTARQPARSLPEPVREISARLKRNFDPTGRLNPGRCVWT